MPQPTSPVPVTVVLPDGQEFRARLYSWHQTPTGRATPAVGVSSGRCHPSRKPARALLLPPTSGSTTTPDSTRAGE
ncbi:hypothetical protein ACFU5Y_18925 [Streptomyces gardneri]|uniref:hypothetical protein n=1 Tax=Streptomyces gardneri TaxID=66892 RepID=UPI00367CE3DE